LRSGGWWIFPVSAALFALALLVDTASAEECRASCREMRSTCVDAAKMSKKSCKEQCRAESDGRGCYEACRDAYVAERDVCKNTVVECREECEKPCEPGAEDCVEGCLKDLRGCVNDVRHEGKSCAHVCTESAEDGIEECLEQPDPLRCIVEHVSGLGGCLRECAEGVRVGIEECTEGAKACRESCSGGSASRAFLDRTESLLD
jgi:hypothetical protein